MALRCRRLLYGIFAALSFVRPSPFPPLSLPRHALATGESLDASDHFRGDAMARALPETSLRRAREFDDSSHRSAGSRHSYRGDLDDSLAWRARCARKPAVPR